MYVKTNVSRLSQGDILEDFEIKNIVFDKEKSLYEITFPYVVVMTQDCDLEWDFEHRNSTSVQNNDKYLQTILFCPAYLAEKFKSGIHLQALNLTMGSWSGDLWKRIKTNQHERFHFMPENEDFALPNLVIDFKHYYTVSRNEIYSLYKEKYKASIDTLYREQLSQRFAYYLSRIGLPTLTPS